MNDKEKEIAKLQVQALEATDNQELTELETRVRVNSNELKRIDVWGRWN